MRKHEGAAEYAGVRFEPHRYEERQVDLGEVVMNYARAGEPDLPPLLLIPGQSESWWGYEEAMALLAPKFSVFAVDVRGQGRSTWTPGRYTFDLLGGDLVRFIDTVIGRSAVVAGNSSGGVLAAWLSAYAPPGRVRGAMLEDPPLFSGELAPRYGHSQRQSSGPVLELWARHIGDQWSIGDWAGFIDAAKQSPSPLAQAMGDLPQPTQAFLEYDPEWSRAFLDGRMNASVPADELLTQVRTPILLSHHARSIDEGTGSLIGALSDFQANKVAEIVRATDVAFTAESFPDAMHAMHASDPRRYADALTTWADLLPSG